MKLQYNSHGIPAILLDYNIFHSRGFEIAAANPVIAALLYFFRGFDDFLAFLFDSNKKSLFLQSEFLQNNNR